MRNSRNQIPNIRCGAFFLFLLLFPLVHAWALENPRETFFETRIRPILLGRCLECHGPDKQKNGLRVDSLSALLKGGKSGPALVRGKPELSLIVQAARGMDDDLKMPPKVPLSKRQKDDLAEWVGNGAFWPANPVAKISSKEHWAFKAPAKVDPPVDPAGWAEPDSMIDRFVSASLRQKGLRPAKRASRENLLRRLYFNLLGLPPTPEQVLDFVGDDSPEAYEELVESLLASPHYGERWGRHWLDLARYADTAGDNSDFPIPEASLYRDYVIDAFNKDKPYDEFIREQLAGDVLAKKGSPELYAERTIATGFVGLSRRFGTYMDEAPELIIEDTLDVVGRGLIGITLKCARCHSHKYDPVSIEDYYGLYGIFASSRYPFPGSESSPTSQRMVSTSPSREMNRLLGSTSKDVLKMRRHIEKTLKDGETAKKYLEWKKKSDQLLDEINVLEVRGEDASEQRDRFSRIDLHAARSRALTEVAGLELRIHGIESEQGLVRAYALEEGEVGDVRMQLSGDPTRWGPWVKRGFPNFVKVRNPPAIPEGSSGRLEFAEWLVRPDHPLTARVMVNRVWQWHFGKPLVATPSNFGIRGAYPTHPGLLDWLAVDFIEGGWSIKRLHRKILLSSTYRLSSESIARNEEVDPANRLYWRFDRRRLDAEAIRDAMLHASGRLELSRPGFHPFPPRKSYKFTQHNPFQAVYPSKHRSVFLMTQRFKRHPFLNLFDGPDTNVSTPVRSTSTVPQQALFLMNGKFVRELSVEFADRMLEAAKEDEDLLDFAHLAAWGRPPTEHEREKGNLYLSEFSRTLDKDVGHAGDRVKRDAWASYGCVLFCSNEFLYID